MNVSVTGSYCDRPPGSPVPGLEHLFFQPSTVSDTDQTLLTQFNTVHQTNNQKPQNSKPNARNQERPNGMTSSARSQKKAKEEEVNRRLRQEEQEAARVQLDQQELKKRFETEKLVKCKEEASHPTPSVTGGQSACCTDQTKTRESKVVDKATEKVPAPKAGPQAAPLDDYRSELAKQIEEKKQRRLAEEAAERERDERERLRLLRDQEELQRAYEADLAARSAKEAAKQGAKEGQPSRKGALPRTPPAAVNRSAVEHRHLETDSAASPNHDSKAAPMPSSKSRAQAEEHKGDGAKHTSRSTDACAEVEHRSRDPSSDLGWSKAQGQEGRRAPDATQEEPNRPASLRRGREQRSAQAEEEVAISSLGYHIGPLPQKPSSADSQQQPHGARVAGRGLAAAAMSAQRIREAPCGASTTHRTKMPLSKALAAAAAAAAADLGERGSRALARGGAERRAATEASTTVPAARARRVEEAHGAGAGTSGGAGRRAIPRQAAATVGVSAAGSTGAEAGREAGRRPDARGVRREVEAARRGGRGGGNGDRERGGGAEDVRGSLDSTSRFLPAGLSLGELFDASLPAMDEAPADSEDAAATGLLDGLRFPLNDSERARLDSMLESLVLA